MGVLVDTKIAVDRLKRAKKGFKFERFNVLFQIGEFFWGVLNGLDPGVGSGFGFGSMSGSKARPTREPIDGIARGAVEMGGLPFDSVSPSRRPRGARRTPQSLSSPASRASDPVPDGFFRGGPSRSQPFKNKDFLIHPSNRLRNRIVRPERGLRSDRKILSVPAGPELRKSVGLLQWGHRTRSLRRASSSLASTLRRAAQPLHHDLRRGWDDCSLPQEPAGRANEETAQ